jgi:hypothetical protein
MAHVERQFLCITMNADSIGGSSPGSKRLAAAWLFVPLVVLMLYVLTWPMIEMKATRVALVGPDGRPYDPGRIYTTLGKQAIYPTWAGKAYHPLHLWYESNGERNLLADYWKWWSKVLNHPCAPMRSS